MHFWWSANLYALTHVQTIVQRYSIQIKKAKFYLRGGCNVGDGRVDYVQIGRSAAKLGIMLA